MPPFLLPINRSSKRIQENEPCTLQRNTTDSSLCVYFFSTLSLSSFADPRTPLCCLSGLNSHLTFFSKLIFSVFPYFKMNHSAPRSSVAAPPTADGYPYPPAPGYGGNPLPQMQPQEKTSSFKKFFKKFIGFFCGLAEHVAADVIADNMIDI